MQLRYGSHKEFSEFDYLPFVEFYRHSHSPDEEGYHFHFHLLFQWLYYYIELQFGKD